MNQIKREIDNFIGEKPRFSQQLRRRIISQIENDTLKKEVIPFHMRIKSITVSSLIIAIAILLMFSYENKDGVDSTLSNTAVETGPNKIQIEQLENQLLAIENKEEVKRLAEHVTKDFLIAMSADDQKVVQDLLTPGAILNDDFTITFENNLIYTKSNWNLYDNIIYTKLSGYGFTDESSDKQQTFDMFYQFTPKEKEGYPIFVGIQLELIDGKWLISKVWEDV